MHFSFLKNTFINSVKIMYFLVRIKGPIFIKLINAITTMTRENWFL
jgi:hypothetical protein